MNDDMIRRQVALDTVERMYKACEGSLEDYHDLLVAAFVDLTPAHGDGDTISRAVAISKVKKLCEGCYLSEHCGKCLTKCLVRKSINQLKKVPPSQPSATDTNVATTDTISRQELLNRTIYNPLHVPYITERDVLDCPSAQPTISVLETLGDAVSRQAAIELFKGDIAAVNELNNLPSQPDRMKYVQESVNIIMSTCKSDSIKDKAFRNAARMIQNAIDGEAPDFETIEELPSAQSGQRNARVFQGIIVEYPSISAYPEYEGKPYFSIKYTENGQEFIGYGTYKSEVLSEYLKEYFMPPTSDSIPGRGQE